MHRNMQEYLCYIKYCWYIYDCAFVGLGNKRNRRVRQSETLLHRASEISTRQCNSGVHKSWRIAVLDENDTYLLTYLLTDLYHGAESS